MELTIFLSRDIDKFTVYHVSRVYTNISVNKIYKCQGLHSASNYREENKEYSFSHYGEFRNAINIILK